MKTRAACTPCDGTHATVRHTRRRGGRRPTGFTLVELAAALAVAAILAAAAYPSYLDTLRHARRAEARAALATLQQAQERWHARHDHYGHLATPADADTLPGISALSARGHYVVAVIERSTSGYTATATATATGDQATDVDCAVLGVRLHEGVVQQGSGAAAIAWHAADPDAGRCWPR